MALNQARRPDRAAVLHLGRVRLPLTLGVAAISSGLIIIGARNWASVRQVSLVGGDAAPALRRSLGLVSSPDFAPPSLALRPRDDLAREAQPFILTTRSAAERRRAVQCLANAIYYEAALEPLDGQRAVAQVVLNRVRDVDFPRSICGVVYQGWARPTGCQFSFTCDGALDRAPVPTLYARARSVAQAALDGYVMAEVGTATHYHTADIDPWWRPTLVRITQVGAHVFYGWMQTSGAPNRMLRRYGGGELKLPQAVIDGRVPRRALDQETPPPIAAGSAETYDAGASEGRVRRIGVLSGEAAQDPQQTIPATPPSGLSADQRP